MQPGLSRLARDLGTETGRLCSVNLAVVHQKTSGAGMAGGFCAEAALDTRYLQ